jgi:hypothetical protein
MAVSFNSYVPAQEPAAVLAYQHNFLLANSTPLTPISNTSYQPSIYGNYVESNSMPYTYILLGTANNLSGDAYMHMLSSSAPIPYTYYLSNTKIALHIFSRPSDQTGVMFADNNILLQSIVCNGNSLSPTLNPDRAAYNVWMLDVTFNPSRVGVPTYTGNGIPGVAASGSTSNGGQVYAGAQLACTHLHTYYVLSIPLVTADGVGSPYTPCAHPRNCNIVP